MKQIDFKTLYKSGTMRSLALIVVVVLMQLFGVGQQEVADTIDTVDQQQGHTVEILISVILLALTGRAAYGRAVAEKPILKKKEPDDGTL